MGFLLFADVLCILSVLCAVDLFRGKLLYVSFGKNVISKYCEPIKIKVGDKLFSALRFCSDAIL